MNVRIGINPLTWTIDDLPEVGGETSLETCLTEARAAGFDGVELGCKFPRTAPELKAPLAPHGLALVSGWYSARPARARRGGGVRGDAAAPRTAVGARLRSAWWSPRRRAASTATARTRLSQRRSRAGATGRASRERLDELGARLQDVGLTLAYHHHMGTVVQTEDEVDRLMDSCDDAVGAPARYRPPDLRGRRSGAGRDAPRRAHRARALQGRAPRRARSGVSTATRVSSMPFSMASSPCPGDGSVDYRAVLAPIARAGYRGWLVVEAEQDPAVAPSAEYANLGYRNLRRLADGLPSHDDRDGAAASSAPRAAALLRPFRGLRRRARLSAPDGRPDGRRRHARLRSRSGAARAASSTSLSSIRPIRVSQRRKRARRCARAPRTTSRCA